MKWIALLLMVVDHIGYYFGEHMPGEIYLLLRLVGRLSFPLFAYSVALGYIRTRSRPRYFARMFLFAAMTEFAFYLTHLLTGEPFFINVLFTFSLAIGCMIFIEWISFARWGRDGFSDTYARNEDVPGILRTRSPAWIVVFAILGIVILVLLTLVFLPDYDVYGIITVLIYSYFLRKGAIPVINTKQAGLSSSQLMRIIPIFGVLLAQNLICFFVRTLWRGLDTGFATLQIFSCCAVFLLLLERPTVKPKRWSKYFFYVFYPAHIVVFMLMKAYLFR